MPAESDCIAAVATPPGAGAIGVVRISGKNVCDVLPKVFEPAGSIAFPLPERLMCYGQVRNRERVVDEVMCAAMYAPRSYTGEDTAEIFCHGGILTTKAVLDAVLQNGARLAEPGEFTKRAFLNGRLDLSQAEAVMELLTAKSDLAHRTSLRKLSGGLSRRVAGFRDVILTWLAHIELSVDYPEHEEEAMNLNLVASGAAPLLTEMERLKATALTGRRINAGVATVIAGRPNVGKSSLLNAILQEDRAIVTSAPGTTRDTLTESLTLHGVPLLLTDTAGIRETMEEAEKAGVERSVAHAQNAELVLFVLDVSEPLTEEDFAAARLVKDSRAIVLFNKCDLSPKIQPEIDNLLALFSFAPPVLKISAKTGQGLDALEHEIKAMFLEGALEEEDILTHARHEDLMARAIEHVRKGVSAIEAGLPEDIIAIDLKAAYALLGEILGEAVGDDLLDRIFSEFCVGK